MYPDGKRVVGSCSVCSYREWIWMLYKHDNNNNNSTTAPWVGLGIVFIRSTYIVVLGMCKFFYFRGRAHTHICIMLSQHSLLCSAVPEHLLFMSHLLLRKNPRYLMPE